MRTLLDPRLRSLLAAIVLLVMTTLLAPASACPCNGNDPPVQGTTIHRGHVTTVHTRHMTTRHVTTRHGTRTHVTRHGTTVHRTTVHRVY